MGKSSSDSITRISKVIKESQESPEYLIRAIQSAMYSVNSLKEHLETEGKADTSTDSYLADIEGTFSYLNNKLV